MIIGIIIVIILILIVWGKDGAKGILGAGLTLILVMMVIGGLWLAYHHLDYAEIDYERAKQIKLPMLTVKMNTRYDLVHDNKVFRLIDGYIWLKRIGGEENGKVIYYKKYAHNKYAHKTKTVMIKGNKCRFQVGDDDPIIAHIKDLGAAYHLWTDGKKDPKLFNTNTARWWYSKANNLEDPVCPHKMSYIFSDECRATDLYKGKTAKEWFDLYYPIQDL